MFPKKAVQELIYFLFAAALFALLAGAVANVSKDQNRVPAICFVGILLLSFACLMTELPDLIGGKDAEARAVRRPPEKDFFADLLEDEGRPARSARENPEAGREPALCPEPDCPTLVRTRMARFDPGELVCIDGQLHLAVGEESLKSLFGKDGNRISCDEVKESTTPP